MRAWCSVVFVLVLASTAVAQTVTPRYANPRGGEVIHIQAPGPTCLSDCDIVITFGGVPSPKVTSLGLGAYDAVAPPHAEGAVDIDILLFRFFPAAHIEGQFAYVVQRDAVLIPMFADGVVGRDSLWSTELWVHNDSDQDAAMLPVVCGDLAGIHDCAGDRLIVKANSARKLPALRATAGGTLLFPPVELSEQLSYDLRLLDAAHLGAGTALPVVRDAAMRRRKLTMLNVPAGNVRTRRRLRILTGGESDFVVRVYDLDSGRQLSERTLIGPRLPTDVFGSPLFTLDDDIFDGTATGVTRLRVEVEETSPAAPTLYPFWAFISATDNATQQVTVISPQ